MYNDPIMISWGERMFEPVSGEDRIEWPFGPAPEELLRRARSAAGLAYVPYSHFHVGAAMIVNGANGPEVLTACNVENASYGLTLCAERSVVAVMGSRGLRRPLAIGIVGSAEGRDDYLTSPCPPCGACRQTLMEFGPDMLVVLASEDGPIVRRLRDLLPCSFSMEDRS